MPPLIAALPIIISVVVAVLKVSLIIKALIIIAAMVLVKILTKSKSKSTGNQLSQGTELQTKIAPDLPRVIMTGYSAIGPSCHYALTYTDDSSKPNRYLVRVFQLSDQPIDSLVHVWDGKLELTFAGDVSAGWFACNQHRTKQGAPAMWMRLYKGAFSGAVADATLTSISGGAWDSSHKGTGLAYLIVKYDYDADAFPNGEPELVFAVKGAKVYDDRKDSTWAWGLGTQRISDPTTWSYSNNAAVLTAQFLRGYKIGNQRIMGVGAEPKDLLPAMLLSAYNTCDQLVTDTGGSQHRYQAALNISSQDQASDILDAFQLSMDGQIFDRGGSITIWPGAVRTPVMNLTEADIDWTTEKSWQPRASLDQLVNHVTGNFVDETNYFQEQSLPPRANSTWETDDGGTQFDLMLSFKAVTRTQQAQRIMKRVHIASRYNGVVAFIGGLWLMEMEQGDWFTLTSPRWGMSSKYLEIQEITLTQDMRVAVIAKEQNIDLDDWAYVSDEFARTDTFWNPPPYDLPVPSYDMTVFQTIDAITGVENDGITFILVSPVGDAAQGFVTGIEVEYAETAGRDAAQFVGGYLRQDQLTLSVSGLKPDTDYSMRARSTDGKRFSDWGEWVNQSTLIASTGKVPATISGPAAISIFADVTGTPKSGELPKDTTYYLQQLGVNVTSGVAWSFSRQSGDAVATITGTGNAGFHVTGPTDSTLSATSEFILSALFSGTTYTLHVAVNRVDDPPTVDGGGGSGGTGSTGSTVILGNTTSTAYDTANAVSQVITAIAGTNGKVVCSAPITFKVIGGGNAGIDVYGKWQWLNGATWTDMGVEVYNTAGAIHVIIVAADEYDVENGTISVSMTKTGLTNGTSYQFRFLWREAYSDGVHHAHYVSGTLTAVGS